MIEIIEARLSELEMVKNHCNSDYYWKRKKRLTIALELVLIAQRYIRRTDSVDSFIKQFTDERTEINKS